MDILFATSELAPMVKVGGLADVVGALSKALRLLGHKVTIALPRYPAIEASGVMVARRLTPLVLPGAAGERTEVTVYDGRLGTGVDLLLLQCSPQLEEMERFSAQVMKPGDPAAGVPARGVAA